MKTLMWVLLALAVVALLAVGPFGLFEAWAGLFGMVIGVLAAIVAIGIALVVLAAVAPAVVGIVLLALVIAAVATVLALVAGLLPILLPVALLVGIGWLIGRAGRRRQPAVESPGVQPGRSEFIGP